MFYWELGNLSQDGFQWKCRENTNCEGIYSWNYASTMATKLNCYSAFLVSVIFTYTWSGNQYHFDYLPIPCLKRNRNLRKQDATDRRLTKILFSQTRIFFSYIISFTLKKKWEEGIKIDLLVALTCLVFLESIGRSTEVEVPRPGPSHTNN